MGTGPFLVLLLYWGAGPAQSQKTEYNRRILEVDTLVHISDYYNVGKIHDHLQAWAKEAATSPDKITKLLAARYLRQTDKLLQVMGQKMDEGLINPRIEDNYLDDRHVRQKRNILGDLIHTMTGLATDDELKKQMKIDEEIRDRIVTTLNRQVSFEKTLANIYSNLSREEETLYKRIHEVEMKGKSDRAHILRIQALMNIAKDDIQDLEDLLEAITTGRANTRHAMKMTQKLGLNEIPTYWVSSLNNTLKGPILNIQTRLYKRVNVRKERRQEGYILMDTDTRAYALHLAFQKQLPITEGEVVYHDRECQDCAVAIHKGQRQYKIVVGGKLSCNGVIKTYAKGMELRVMPNETCENDRIEIGIRSLQEKIHKIDFTDDRQMELAILRKTIQQNKMTVHEKGDPNRQYHDEANLQLQHDLEQAQMEVNTFIQATKTDMTTNYIQDYTVWIILALVTMVVMGIATCIIIRSCKRTQTEQSN